MCVNVKDVQLTIITMQQIVYLMKLINSYIENLSYNWEKYIVIYSISKINIQVLSFLQIFAIRVSWRNKYITGFMEFLMSFYWQKFMSTSIGNVWSIQNILRIIGCILNSCIYIVYCLTSLHLKRVSCNNIFVLSLIRR